METQYANIQDTDLLCLINRRYGIGGEHIWLHRESGGRVYYIRCPEGRKVFKLYRPIDTQNAIQSTGILSYLDGCGFPVVRIIPATDGGMHIRLDTPRGACIGILFEFARGRCIGFLHRWRDGKQPLIHPGAEILGRQVGLMHRLWRATAAPCSTRDGSATSTT